MNFRTAWHWFYAVAKRRPETIARAPRAKQPVVCKCAQRGKGCLELKMFMDMRFSTLISLGLLVAEESDHKLLITILKKGLENEPPYISRLLFVLHSYGP